jgi:protein-L-isoaspartate(D-aspartate) O-methyltransferase
MDFDKARYNMVEQQVRPWDVLDPRVLEVISSIPRENFTPVAYKNLSYADTRIPIGSYEQQASFMLNPIIEGRILQHLAICDDDVVLEIGTGSGYLTACIAKLARHVDSVDINPDMTTMAEKNLTELGISNFLLRTGDASNGWYECKPAYDAIAITGSLPAIPECYKRSLKEGGRLFVVTGDAPVMTAQLITRINKKEWKTESVFETCIDSLVHGELPEHFVF